MQSIIASILPSQKGKKHYMEAYNLSSNQYDMLDDFYNRQKNFNNLISTKLIEDLLLHTVKSRQGQICLTKEDITRLVSLVDQDQDGCISFDELINLLNLSMASRSNLPSRIELYVKSNSNTDAVEAAEATACLDYLNEFYSPDSEHLNKVHQKFTDSNNVLFSLLSTIVFADTTKHSARLVAKLTGPVSKKQFAEQLSEYYDSSIYVRF